MSYRTYINGHEWLRENVMYDEILEVLTRQGCPFDEENCVDEPFEVKDLDGLVRACEKVIIRLYKQNYEIANFRPIVDSAIRNKNDLTVILKMLQNRSYIFMSVMLLRYIGDEYEDWETYYTYTKDGLIREYKLKNGKCLFEAYK